MEFIPIIFGGFVNGYSIARHFFETYSCKSVIIDFEKRFSEKSIFVDYLISPSPENEDKFINFLITIAEQGRFDKKKPIIFATNDIWLIPLSKHRDKLSKYYLYTFSDWSLLSKLTIKEKLYNFCEDNNILYPKTEIIDNNRNVFLEFPVLVKPNNIPEFSFLFPNAKRNKIFNSKSEFYNYITKMYSKGYKDKFIVQEYIPGGVENLYTATTYSNVKGILLGLSIGHKITQCPMEAGTITSGLIDYQEEIHEAVRIFLQKSMFYGIANTEFKKHHLNGRFYLIEINPRPGMWNFSALRSGVNLFKILIDDLLLGETVKLSIGKEKVLWSIIPLSQIKMQNDKILKYEYTQIIDPRNNKDESSMYKIIYITRKIKEIIKSLLFKLNLKEIP